MSMNHATLANQYSTLDTILKFPDVTRPVIRHQHVDGGCRDAFNRSPVLDCVLVEEAVGQYRPQLELYRSALAKLTGLEESAISCQLLFTHTHSLLDVD